MSYNDMKVLVQERRTQRDATGMQLTRSTGTAQNEMDCKGFELI